MWPRVNRWGSRRREELIRHIDLCTTLLGGELLSSLVQPAESQLRAGLPALQGVLH